jgi:small subunit ribosomal protein S4
VSDLSFTLFISYNGHVILAPKGKIARKFGEAIIGPVKALQKKNYAPGMHGRGRKRKTSEYAEQLQAKQK